MSGSYKRVPVVKHAKVRLVHKLDEKQMAAIERNTWERIAQNQARREAAMPSILAMRVGGKNLWQ